MANVKNGAFRESIIDRCLRNRRGYSTQEIFDKCNDALERRGDPPINALNTIRNDIMAIENRWHIVVEQIKSGREKRYRYRDPNFSIYNTPLNEEDLERHFTIGTPRHVFHALLQEHGPGVLLPR